MKMELTRRYFFAAAHRLHHPGLSAEENARLYGKCNNPHGHGHNYALEVTLRGPVNPQTGMIASTAELDAFVEREILRAFDHKNLNRDVLAFRERVPTTENLCIEIFRRLEKFPGAALARVRVEETAKNTFEYAGGPLERSE
jgi:6-pyruvoyltetrahydropterin/6-carboxytetrahydropterin synthase